MMMKTYVDEYFENLNGPQRRSITDDYRLDFGKMRGNLMVVLACGGEVIDGGLMSYRNFLLSLQTHKLIFNPCRVVSVFGSLQVWSDCDGDTLLFDYIPSSLLLGGFSEHCYQFNCARPNLDPDLLIPAIVFDRRAGRVLMVGATCQEALAITEEKGLATFYSRTKGVIWTKGETSGNLIEVTGIRYNSSGDGAVIYETVLPPKTVCHNGTSTCFHYNDQLTKLFG